MTDSRYNRWQGLAIAQFSVAVALVTVFSGAGLGVGLSLLQNKEFPLPPALHIGFTGSLLLLLLAGFLSCGAVVTRTLDFRLTARTVRNAKSLDDSSPLQIFGVSSAGYGRATWRLFWASCITLLGGIVLLVVCIGNAYAPRLF